MAGDFCSSMDGKDEGSSQSAAPVTVDLRRGRAAEADLTGKVHQLPCCIKHDGPTPVSHYFKPKHTGKNSMNVQLVYAPIFYIMCVQLLNALSTTHECLNCVEMEVDGLRVEEAYFRGRNLHGTTVALPHGYSGNSRCLLLSIFCHFYSVFFL